MWSVTRYGGVGFVELTQFPRISSIVRALSELVELAWCKAFAMSEPITKLDGNIERLSGDENVAYSGC